MVNRVVSEKEFRAEFRRQVLLVCDFSQKKTKHVLGDRCRQMDVDVGAEIVKALLARYKADGRAIDKDMVHLMTPKGARQYASSQINQLGKMKLTHGANAVETVWKSLGELVPTGRKGRSNVWVAKNGATDVEMRSVRDLRTGKLNAKILINEQLVDAINESMSELSGRRLGEVYAETCTEYFKAIGDLEA